MNTFFLTLGTLIVAVLVALFAVPPFIDWNSYRGVFEEEASRILGREVRVAGDVQVRLLPQPFAELEGVTIADAPGVTGEPFLRARRFTLRLAVPPLLRGVLEARNIEIDRARLRLRIDEDGRGNWQKLTMASNSLNLKPTAVALDEVTLNRGEITLEGPTGTVLSRLRGLQGTLSAPAAIGPYRFVGAADFAGARHDLRVATSAWTADAMTVKLTARADGSRVTIDGQLATSDDAPFRFTGTLDAQLPDLIDGPVDAATAGDTGIVELQGALAADASRLDLTALRVSFDRAGRPQQLLGSAFADLSGDRRLKIDLSSRWLDLDGGVGERASSRAGKGAGATVGGLHRLSRLLTRSLASVARVNPGDTSIGLRIDQATVAGEALSDVRLEAALNDGAINVSHLSARAPGRTVLVADVQMPLTEGYNVETASGRVLIKGGDAGRFAAWAGLDDDLAAAHNGAGFRVESELRLTPEQIALTDAVATIGRTSVIGRMTVPFDEAGTVDVSLGGPTVVMDDLALMPGLARQVGELLGTTGGARDGGASVGARPPTGPLRSMRLSLEAGELTNSGERYRNVAIALVRRRNGAVEIDRLEAHTDDGLSLSLRGSLGARPVSADAGGGLRSFALTGVLAAENARAVSAGARLLRDVTGVAIAPTAVEALAPMSVSFRASRSGDERNQASPVMALDIDGHVAGNAEVRLVGSHRAAQGTANWRSGRLALDLTATEPGRAVVLPWLRQTVGRLSATGRAFTVNAGASTAQSAARDTTDGGPASQASRKTRLRVTGIAQDGLLLEASVSSGDDQLRVSGNISLADGAPANVNVFADLDAQRPARLLDAIGIPARWSDGLGATRASVSLAGPIDGTGSPVGTPGPSREPLALTVETFRTGEFSVAGRLKRRVQADGRPKWAGRLTIDQLMLARLMEPLFDDDADASADQRRVAGVSGTEDGWLPSRRVARHVPDAFDLDVRLDVARLSLMPEMVLRNVRLVVEGAADGKARVAFSDAMGPIGARVAAEVTFEKNLAGVRAQGQITGEALDLSELGEVGDATEGSELATTTGGLSWTMSFSGIGQSADAVLRLASGQGRVTLDNATLAGLGPSAVARVAAALPGDDNLSDDALKESLRAALSQTSLSLGSPTIRFRVRDGTATFDPVSVVTAGGTATNTSTVELATLRYDSRWRLAPSASGEAPPLPPVRLITTGTLLDPRGSETRIDAEGLAREMIVRRLEGNVAELERLRRLDEERAEAAAAARQAREAEAAAKRARREADNAAARNRAPVIIAPLPIPGSNSGNAGALQERSDAGPVVPPVPMRRTARQSGGGDGKTLDRVTVRQTSNPQFASTAPTPQVARAGRQDTDGGPQTTMRLGRPPGDADGRAKTQVKRRTAVRRAAPRRSRAVRRRRAPRVDWRRRALFGAD